MLIPDYWADAKRTTPINGRMRTIRRFGWSLVGQADAQAMADERAEDAVRELSSGASIRWLEPKRAYNGADGVPIREEVLSRHGESVITRNSYGSHCLNTPRVLIADVDFEYLDSRGTACLTIAVLLVAMIGTLIALAGAGWVAIPQVILIGVSSLVLIPMAVLLVRDWLSKAWVRSPDGFGPLTRQRIDRFLETNPDWAIRIYETPNGMRLIATHRLFEAREAEVERFFEAIVADPVYRRMCRNQNCFRARLTAKPWRMPGFAAGKIHGGVWPIPEVMRPERAGWVREYEAKAIGFAACRYVDSVGSGNVHSQVRAVVELHDRLSRADQPELAMA
jgi:hypothetical protein